jgi:hypothetical protein
MRLSAVNIHSLTLIGGNASTYWLTIKIVQGNKALKERFPLRVSICLQVALQDEFRQFPTILTYT